MVHSGAKYRFSIRDVLVLITVIAVLMALLLPKIMRAREVARQSVCAGRMKNLGLALHNYYSAFQHLPSAMDTSRVGNAGRLSGWVSLLPFLDAQVLYETITNPMTVNGFSYPAFGPAPWDNTYLPWQEQLNVLRCPSEPPTQNTYGATNFVFSVGDLTTNLHSPPSMNHVRGVFAPGRVVGFRQIMDGLSNTVMMMETANKRGNSMAGQFVVDVPTAKLSVPQDCYQFVDPTNDSRYVESAKLSDLGRGGNWADGAGGYALAHAILPPNGPSCAIEGTAEVDGIFTASSRHLGGCHIAMCDGAVVFITNSIDTGDLEVAVPTPVSDPNAKPFRSPYGIWGKLGTRAGHESIEERLNQ